MVNTENNDKLVLNFKGVKNIYITDENNVMVIYLRYSFSLLTAMKLIQINPIAFCFS